MKVKYFLLSALLAGGMMTSCSDNDEVRDGKKVDDKTEEASLSVQLVGNNTTGRAAAEASVAEENAIKNYAIYIYNNEDKLERRVVEASVTGSDPYNKTISGLKIGPKAIVVFANLNTYPDSVDVVNYTALSTQITLEQQNADIATNGLIMGAKVDYALPLTGGSVTVPVERAVAKIVVGDISINKETTYTETLAISDVHIMKALPNATLEPTAVTGAIGTTSGQEFYGGIADDTLSTKVQKAYLTNALTVTETTPSLVGDRTPNIAFYVFPNQLTNEETLITFEGTYDGATVYFPFRINDLTSGNGNLIQRNTVHTINVVFRNPGTTHPETPLDPADLEISVTAAPWALTLTHELEW